MFIRKEELDSIKDNLKNLKNVLGHKEKDSSSLFTPPSFTYSYFYEPEVNEDDSTGLFKKVEEIEEKLDKVIEYLGISFKESKQTKSKFIKIKK